MIFKYDNENYNMIIFDEVYPIGHIYFSMNPDNPSTYLGGGTWEQIAQGRTIVNIDTDDTDFDTVGKTGASKNQELRAIFGAFDNTPGKVGYKTTSRTSNVTYRYGGNLSNSGSTITTNRINHNTPITTMGGSMAIPTVQPYITTYIWKRTA